MATIQPAAPTADHALVREPKVREDASFAAEHPRSAAFRDRGLDLLPNGLPMAWLRGSYHRQQRLRAVAGTDFGAHSPR